MTEAEPSSQNFSQQRVRSRNFRKQDLRGADFSHADIRGVNFTAANLTDASFHSATAGSRSWSIWLTAALSILSCAIVGLFSIPVADTVNVDYFEAYGPKDAIFACSTVFIFVVNFIRLRSLVAAALINVLTILVLWVLLVIVDFYQSGELLYGLINSQSLSIDSATLMTTFLAGIGMVMTLSPVTLASFKMKTNAQRPFSEVEAVALTAALTAALPGVLLPGLVAKVSSLAIALFLSGVSFYAARQIVDDSQSYPLLRSLALRLTTLGATSFRQTILTRATFASAQLNGTDFTKAQLAHTNFHHALGLNYVRANHPLLSQKAIRQLLVSYRGQGQSFTNSNLQDAFLPAAELARADLAGANLSNAYLKGANLADSNLSRVEALGTNFEGCYLTGSCLQSWNIDSTTRLHDIHCDYVYLLSNQAERRPSSGYFQTGEFTRLFEEALHTVDLIFRNGLDFSAFVAAFNQAQQEHPETELSIRSFENKQSGTVLVKVNVPAEADKSELHHLLTEQYESAVARLEAQHKKELQAKDDQIAIYQQHQSDLQALTRLLTQPQSQSAKPSESVSNAGKRVVLKLSGGTPETGLSATLRIAMENEIAHVEVSGRLPPFAPLIETSEKWRSLYYQCCQRAMRISVPPAQMTNVSYRDIFKICYREASTLQQKVNRWLNSEDFRPIKECLLEQLQTDDAIRVILQADDLRIQQLPLHLWDWFERYPKAELSLSHATYHHIAASEVSKDTANILCILGDSSGINVQRDRKILEQLPGTNLLFLTEPDRQQLNHALWERNWDILFFAGHSRYQPNRPGHLCISPTDSLSLNELKHGLRKAIEQGLKLAIFNSCDGLELVSKLENLPLPPTILMRSPVPDRVAQEFLKNFLQAFSKNLPLHLAVREARERLQGLEHQYPFATWLPVIYQNPIAKPLYWQNLIKTDR